MTIVMTSDEMLSPELIIRALSHCTGTEYYYPLMNGLRCTDGIKRMAALCKSNWLVTDIAAFMSSEPLQGESFVVWKLTVNRDVESMRDGNEAILKATDGDGKELFTYNYGWTDFPLDEMIIYCQNEILLLPSEY